MSASERRDGGLSARSYREEEELMRASRELLARDQLAALASRPARCSGDANRKAADEKAVSESFARETQPTGLEAARDSRRRAEYEEEDTGPLSSSMRDWDDLHDRLSIKSEESENNSVDQEKGFGIQKVEDFVDVESLSAASRRTAAPHIYNIFEQIFIQGTDAESRAYKVPELPEELRQSLRMSGRYVEGQFGLAGPRAHVQLELNQTMDMSVGRGKKGFLQQIAADLAVALKVDKTRLEVVDCVPSSDLDRTVVEVRVLPEKDGRPPSAMDICEKLRAEVQTRGSFLKSMTSTRRAVDVKFREMQPQRGLGLEVPVPGMDQQYEFSLIRGGIVLDDRGARPAMSAVHSQTPVQLGVPVAEEEEARMQREALHAALREEEMEVAAARKDQAVRGGQEGFWVDVEGGKGRASQQYKGAYGTFVPKTPRNKMPGAVLVLLCAGGLIMVSLALYLVYYRFFVEPFAAPPSAGPNAQSKPS